MYRIAKEDREVCTSFLIESVSTDDDEAAERGVTTEGKPRFTEQQNVVIVGEKLEMTFSLKERVTIELTNEFNKKVYGRTRILRPREAMRRMR